MSLWSERLRSDRASLDDFLAWIDRRQEEVARQVWSLDGPPEALMAARGAKKVLDDLRRCATMQDREEQANARFRSAVGPGDSPTT